MYWLLCLLIFVPNVVADCPPGSVFWSPVPTCYSFMTAQLNFSDAERACNGLNGHLASIHDVFTNAFILREAQSEFSSDFNMTIGFTCTNGNCSWTDGSPFDFNEFSVPPTSSGCGTMSLSTGYWNIENCFYERFYICEIPENVVTTKTTTVKPTTNPATTTPSKPVPLCPSDDWVYFNQTNSCYYWTSTFDWATAEEFCANESAHLASIHSYAELAFLKFIYNGNLWIGLHAESGPIEFNTEWQWTDGSYLDYLPWQGTYGLPNLNYNYQCVQAAQSYILNTNCSSKATGICKKPSTRYVSTTSSPPVPKCPTGWTYYNGNKACYLGPTPKLNQSALEKYCTSRGGHLPSIHSTIEMNFLSYVMKTQAFWTGLYTAETLVQLNTTWQWTDKTPVDYMPWYGSIPSLDNKICVMASGTSFYNVDCSNTYVSFCQKLPYEATPTSSPISTTTLKPPKPSDILCNQDHVWTNYPYFIPLTKMNWTVAEEYCELCGGYLTSVHSLNQLDDLVNYIYKIFPFGKSTASYWIGLYTDNNGRTWKWTDGSSYDYSYWMSGYPRQGGSPSANLYITRGNTYLPGTYGMKNDYGFTTNLYGICNY